MGVEMTWKWPKKIPRFVCRFWIRIPTLSSKSNKKSKWAVAKIQVLQNGILSFFFGLKVPFGFPCLAHVCLSNSFGFVCFSTAYVTWRWLSRSFLEALYFCLRSCKALFNLFSFLRCITLLFEVEGLACFYEWMDGASDYAAYAWLHFLPRQSTCCKFQKCFKQSCKNGLVLMRHSPSKVNKSWNCLRFLLRFGFGLGKLIHRVSCSITLIRAYWRQTATLPISQRPLPLN